MSQIRYSGPSGMARMSGRGRQRVVRDCRPAAQVIPPAGPARTAKPELTNE